MRKWPASSRSGPSRADAADLAGLVSALNSGEVQFVVIGGVAVGAHGHIRATEDLDIVPDPDRDNLDRLGNVLVRLDARLASDQERRMDLEIRSSLYRRRNLVVTTRRGDLDVVQRSQASQVGMSWPPTRRQRLSTISL